jgi:hypothetical protein
MCNTKTDSKSIVIESEIRDKVFHYSYLFYRKENDYIIQKLLSTPDDYWYRGYVRHWATINTSMTVSSPYGSKYLPTCARSVLYLLHRLQVRPIA